MAGNPLEGYFRKPAIFIELPSRGNYYKDKPKLSADNELAVFGMTAKDELHLKNPDALLNGEGIIKVLESVTPDISSPHDMPIPDFNSVLIAMRIASYGKEMEYLIKCTNITCLEIDTVTFDLYDILATTTFLEPEYIVKLESGVKVSVKPTDVTTQNKVSIGQLEQSRLMDIINSEDSEDIKMSRFGKAFDKLTSITFDLVQDGIISVTLPDENATVVDDRVHIREWMMNITKPEYEKIQTKITEINLIGTNSKFDHTCTKCKTEISSQIQFDPISFFG